MSLNTRSNQPVPQQALTHPWKSYGSHARATLQEIDMRRRGLIKGVLTPWSKLNEETINGFDWNSIIQLAGNSGSGKTLIKDEFTRKAKMLNPGQDFAILDFQFEMTGSSSVMRDVSNKTGYDLKKINSAFTPVSDGELSRIRTAIDELSGLPIYVVDTPKTCVEIEKIVTDFQAFVNKKVIYTIDHSMLVKKTPTDKDEFAVIRDLASSMIRIKKKNIGTLGIVLNQLNNEFEKQERQQPNNISAFPTKRDIYGGSPLYFASDVVIVAVIPANQLPPGTKYGPSALDFVVEPNLMVWHMLKNRFGTPNAKLRMQADLRNMKIIDPSNT